MDKSGRGDNTACVFTTWDVYDRTVEFPPNDGKNCSYSYDLTDYITYPAFDNSLDNSLDNTNNDNSRDVA